MKIFSMLLVLALSMPATAQTAENDWANHNRYAAANAALEQAPQVVLMGNSITDHWPARSPEFWAAHPEFCGRGISGQTSAQMLCRFRRDVLDLHPQVVAILAGTNDIARNQGYISLDLVMCNIQSMVELALQHGIKVAVCSVPPSSGFGWRPEVQPAQPIRELNALIKDNVDKLANPDVVYVDYYTPMANDEGGLDPELSPDNCHPNAQGYAIMEQVLMQAISPWLTAN